jgi:hypothetical protein
MNKRSFGFRLTTFVQPTCGGFHTVNFSILLIPIPAPDA